MLALLFAVGYLERGVTYKAVISPGAKDLACDPLAKSKAWYFTVKPMTDAQYGRELRALPF